MNLNRIAVVYDDRLRPETTGHYCREALQEFVAVEHVLPGDLSGLSGGFDGYLCIDDGTSFPWPDSLRPALFWAIDTHLSPDGHLGRASPFDAVFAAQRDGAEMLRCQGIARVDWLPLACDPRIHRRYEGAKEFDFCFVGNLFEGPRQELLQLLKRKYPKHFVGRRYFDEMAKTYSRARTVFNRSLRNDINMRVFEALACGSLLLTNDLCDNGQEELFQDGLHLATYTEAEELLDKLAFYLQHEAEREKIAATGRNHVLAQHTYRHRMETILSRLEHLAGTTSVAVSPHRGQSYFQHQRPELLALVPHSAKRILDVGCGAGNLGAALIQRQGATVVGLERDEGAAALAGEQLQEVLVGDVESMDLPFEPESFDAVVCGDILEHLRDPAGFLQRVRSWLASDGSLVTSIPNVRHHSVVTSLLQGHWTYEEAGLLDRDHLRFFTRREIQKLLQRTDFIAQDWQAVVLPEDTKIQQNLASGEVDIDGLCLRGLDPAEVEEFFAYQYLIRATPSSRSASAALTSILLVTHNQLDFTRLCVESIQRSTTLPYELIFIDNASTDGTLEYLQSLESAQVIVNEENRGFPAAVNQGIHAAKGEQILLLNNDTVVPPGWLERLLEVSRQDPAIGLVGPCSNCVSGDQQVPVDYDDLSQLDSFAQRWSQAHRGEYDLTDRLIGFCLLIRREVIDRVGLFDERFGTGCFEDDDYTLRALAAGYRAVIARDAFVHHFGGRTFVGAGIDYSALMQRNQLLFQDKWRTESAIAGDLQLSLCMIVRDNAGTIGPALKSIRPWVDEMVVVDTGSTDATPRIAESFGARVFHFSWCKDFSAARNESLRYAQGRWIFWMDSDDTIDADCGRKLRELVGRHHPENLLGLVMQVHCPGPGESGKENVTVVDHVKLFRNLPELRFEGRIHEQILPAIRRLGGEVAWTDLFVTHTGYDHTPEGQERKKQRDLELLHLEHSERGEHPFTLFNLGMTYADIGRHTEAVDYLRRSIAAAKPGESHLPKAYALLVYSLMQCGDLTGAKEACQGALEQFPDDAELRFRHAVLLHEVGRLDDAIAVYQSILEHGGKRHFASIDSGIKGFKARHNLAVIYSEKNAYDLAEVQWRKVLAEQPDYAPAVEGLATCLRHQGKL